MRFHLFCNFISRLFSILSRPLCLYGRHTQSYVILNVIRSILIIQRDSYYHNNIATIFIKLHSMSIIIYYTFFHYINIYIFFIYYIHIYTFIFISIFFSQAFSRMDGKADNRDTRVLGGDPCLESSFESMELCSLQAASKGRKKVGMHYWSLKMNLALTRNMVNMVNKNTNTHRKPQLKARVYDVPNHSPCKGPPTLHGAPPRTLLLAMLTMLTMLEVSMLLC